MSIITWFLELTKGYEIALILLDFSAAFHCVDHCILFKLMQHFRGISVLSSTCFFRIPLKLHSRSPQLQHTCIWRIVVKLRHSIRAVSGELLSRRGLGEAQ